MTEMLLVYTADKQAHALGCQPSLRTSASGCFCSPVSTTFRNNTLELIVRTWHTLQAGRSCSNKSNNHFSSYRLFGVRVLAAVCVSANKQLEQCMHEEQKM